MIERSRGRKLCSRMSRCNESSRETLESFARKSCGLFFATPSSFLKPSLRLSVFLSSMDGVLESLIPRFAGVGIDLWFINGISLGSWFVTVVVVSFSLVITRYCRWNQINPDWKSTRRSSITVVLLHLSHRSLIIPEFYDRLRAN